MKFPVFLLLLLLSFSTIEAQKPVKWSAAEIHQAIKKLNVLGTVLYVAAHPDDENQRFISYCANEKLFDVTYLSLTRGDGGQNLIGPELRELLGVLRTEELLMARSVDGGMQRFSRANDFGFSKSPDETLLLWDKKEVLSDVVWAIRETQPDVIVNRFYHDKKYDTHGHHTASAMLSVEAFDLAGKADAYPEQLKYTSVWQPRRQFFNTSWWFFGGREKFDQMDKSHLFSTDLGVYFPLKGKSNNEVAAEARSMHRCQGFGSISSRGESVDWFDFIKGDRPSVNNNLFEGINTSWSRVPGAEKIGKLLAKTEQNYRSDNPSASVPALLEAMQLIKALPDGFWKRRKLTEIKEVIRACLGVYLEATAESPSASPGDLVKLRLEAINRSDAKVALTSCTVLPGIRDSILAQTLQNNKDYVLNWSFKLPANAPFTGPYWLQKPNNEGMYTVDEQTLRGQPETSRYLQVRWTLTVNGVALEYTTDVAHKTEEPAFGELWRPFEVLPPVFVEFTESSYLFTENTGNVTVKVKAGRDNISGKVSVKSASGWTFRGGSQAFSLKKKGEEAAFNFTVEAGAAIAESTLEAVAEVDGVEHKLRLIPIKYDHIPQQSVLRPAQVRAARANLRVTAQNVGYYMGAGDDIPAALRQMGCNVTLLSDKDFSNGTLQKMDAVVLGIRAYNTKEALTLHHSKLMEYVQNGGTLVTQYNNNFDLYVETLSPYPIKLSRTRVTDEQSEVRFLLPQHPILNEPNKINADDFKGWVQERGLYFPGEWDVNYAAPLSCNDPGEKAADGALLVAAYGKGQFIYTGISFFRELPAGVPGAYRLFANLISAKTSKP